MNRGLSSRNEDIQTSMRQKVIKMRKTFMDLVYPRIAKKSTVLAAVLISLFVIGNLRAADGDAKSFSPSAKRQIYNMMSNKMDSRSARPAGDSIFDLGASGTEWANLYVDRVVVSTQHYVLADSGNGHGSTNTTIRRFSNSSTVGTAITYADSAANGASFTINQNGLYAIEYTDVYTAGVVTFGISVNSSQLTTTISGISIAGGRRALISIPANTYAECSAMLYLTAGDVVRAHTNGFPDGVDFEMLRITKIW